MLFRSHSAAGRLAGRRYLSSGGCRCRSQIYLALRWMAMGPTESRCVHSRPLGPGAQPQTPSGFDRRGDAAACQLNAARCPVMWALAHDPAVAHSLRGAWAAGLRPPRRAHPRGCGAAGGASLCTRTRGAPSTPPALVGWALGLGARLVAPVLCWKPAHPFSLTGCAGRGAPAAKRLANRSSPYECRWPPSGVGSFGCHRPESERERERERARESIRHDGVRVRLQSPSRGVAAAHCVDKMRHHATPPHGIRS